MIKRRLGLRPNSFVVELGSNDGYLLQHFLALVSGCPVSNPRPMWQRSLGPRAFPQAAFDSIELLISSKDSPEGLAILTTLLLLSERLG